MLIGCFCFATSGRSCLWRGFSCVCRLGVPDVSGVSQDLTGLGLSFLMSVAKKAAELTFDIRDDSAQTARHRGSRTILHSIL